MADKHFAVEPISHSGKLYKPGDILGDDVDASSLAELVRIKAARKLDQAVQAERSSNPVPDRAEREALARAAAEAEVTRQSAYIAELKAQLAALQQAAADGVGGGAAIEMAAQAEADLKAAEVGLERSEAQSAAAAEAVKAAASKSGK